MGGGAGSRSSRRHLAGQQQPASPNTRRPVKPTAQSSLALHAPQSGHSPGPSGPNPTPRQAAPTSRARSTSKLPMRVRKGRPALTPPATEMRPWEVTAEENLLLLAPMATCGWSQKGRGHGG